MQLDEKALSVLTTGTGTKASNYPCLNE